MPGTDREKIRISSGTENMLDMDARVLDILSAVAGFIVLLVFLLVLPTFMEPGIAYLLAIFIFILTMSGAGFYINKAIS